MSGEIQLAGWRAALAFACAIAALPALAEPFETNPVLSASDADYAAGKQAMDKKNWAEAAKRFEVALKAGAGADARLNPEHRKREDVVQRGERGRHPNPCIPRRLRRGQRDDRLSVVDHR